jgi:GAF domain-containing protein
MLNLLYQNACEQALAMLHSGTEKKSILNYLATEAEKGAGPDAVASIMILDQQGLLRNGASPKLPADYLKAIDGIRPDPNLGTCASAAATGNVVITPSFYADNKWAELRHLPTALGFVGAWSMPIKTKDNKVLGTFGTYFRKQREPSSEEMNGTKLLADAASIILQYNKKAHLI